MNRTLNRINYNTLYANLHYFNVAVGQCEKHYQIQYILVNIIIAIVEQ